MTTTQEYYVLFSPEDNVYYTNKSFNYWQEDISKALRYKDYDRAVREQNFIGGDVRIVQVKNTIVARLL